MLRWSGWMACGLMAAGLGQAGAQRVAAVDSASRVAVSGSVPPAVKAARDLGDAPGDWQLAMSIHFNMTASQQAELTQLLAAQQMPGSAAYHRWLSPEEFAARFGLGAADAARVSAWLQAQGFSVEGLTRGGLSVRFTGSVAQAQQAFGTAIHRVQLAGGEHIANVSAPSLPAAIAGVTLGIAGLDDVTPTPHAVGRAVAAPVAASAGAPKPLFTSQISGNHYLAPRVIYTIYDQSAALTANINGTGVTISVVGQADISLSDIAVFRSVSGLPASAPTIKVYGADPGAGSTGDVAESEADVEWAGAAAPGANILFVTATNVLDGALASAIQNNVAPVISYSYGYNTCEASYGASKIAYYNQLLAQAAAQGITIVAASGNDGATGCNDQVVAANLGLAVDFPASSPYVTAVGGTILNDTGGSYWNTSNGSYKGSAISYIPEVVWNETGASNPAYLQASGGGASAYFPKPSWQVGTPADLSRDVPDVSLAAAETYNPYLACVPSYCVNGYANASNYLFVVGGTDIATPVFAGFMGLVVQQQGRVGVANNTIYALANNSTYAGTVFHDVTVGNNASPCLSGTVGCPAGGGSIGYSAAAGYDRATGWGSVDVFNLVSNWAKVTPLATTPTGTVSSITNLTVSAGSVGAGTPITLTATVASGTSSSTATPTGAVSFAVDNTAVGSAVTLANGVATYSLSTGTLSAGTHTVQASYAGDSTFAGSKGQFTININAASGPDFTLAPSSNTLTVSSGGISQAVVFTIAPVAGFTGPVTLTASSSAPTAMNLVLSTTTVNISGTSSATTQLQVFAYTPLAVTSPVQYVQGRAMTWRRTGAGVMLAGLMLLLVPRRRKLPMLLVFAMMGGSAMLGGCSNGSSAATTSGPSHTNTPAGSYTVTVTATGNVNGTSVSHSSTIALTIQ